ncbi:MAG: DEAD/DEAH box helicase [Anaerolineaceae bacterium]|nr:DEAD/DEAH box helicase [Anaerolineaceae bacterium]
MTNPFYRLSPFIQDFIYREKWDVLREIQVKAIETVLDTPNHILITSGTASGKTEAAFLPILTELHEHPSATIGAMYIGPLKALINDQFYRLQSLLEESHIPVQSWHGDVGQSQKTRFIRNAQGILQITPESLEAMLINRQTELSRLFGDLRFVVIDEVHAFIGSDRGRQVLCQLERLARYQAHPARRIGLSATLGEPELAMKWLAGGTDYPVTHIHDTKGRREVMLGLEHFISIEEDNDVSETTDETPAPTILAPDGAEVESASDTILDQTDDLFGHMYQMVGSAKKTLIFANSRNETEEIIHSLRRIANDGNEDEDGYYVHHGSISAVLRERAEEDMRDPDKQACVAATITLELGIDLGNLDQVLQLNATSTVSSFVQRLGRSGRRGSAARMFFYSRETAPKDDASLGERIPWNLLQTIAIIQLYLEEKWVEPPEIPRLPLSLLYHQTMSAITAQTELAPPDLAERVLGLSPFAEVSLDQYRDLLRHLLEIEHLERIEGGGLIIGFAGEKIVNNYHFYATFRDETAYLVREGTREIGTIQSLPVVGDRFRLAGRAWEVVSVDEDKRVIQVERVKGKAQAFWAGGGAAVHTTILQRIRQVLEEDQDYGYLQKRAIIRLNEARRLAQKSDLTQKSILPLGGSRFMLLPWQGTQIVDTMSLLLGYAGIPVREAGKPYYLEVDATNLKMLRDRMKALIQDVPPSEALIAKLPVQAIQVNKYDRYIPEDLLRTAYALDRLDVPGAVSSLNDMIR